MKCLSTLLESPLGKFCTLRAAFEATPPSKHGFIRRVPDVGLVVLVYFGRFSYKPRQSACFLSSFVQGQGGPGRGNFKYTQGVRNQQPGAPNMPPQQQQQQQGAPQQSMPGPGPQAAPATNESLSAAALAAAPPEKQKNMIGERLYPLIYEGQPQLAGKITGEAFLRGRRVYACTSSGLSCIHGMGV